MIINLLSFSPSSSELLSSLSLCSGLDVHNLCQYPIKVIQCRHVSVGNGALFFEKFLHNTRLQFMCGYRPADSKARSSLSLHNSMSLTDSHKSVFDKSLKAEITLLSYFVKLKPADDSRDPSFVTQYSGLLLR
jgi:hypothetical protein